MKPTFEQWCDKHAWRPTFYRRQRIAVLSNQGEGFARIRMRRVCDNKSRIAQVDTTLYPENYRRVTAETLWYCRWSLREYIKENSARSRGA